jgi:LppP/LprE lipoprotein
MGPMSSHPLRGSLLALALLAIPLAGCGSNTKTVTVESTPAAAASTPGTTPARTTTTSTQATDTSSSATSPATTTRSAPEPSFTEQEDHPEGASAATAVLRAHGYTPNDSSEYHSGQTLRVLVGTRSGSGDGYGQQAFFFIDGHYLGTDTKEPSAKLKVVSQGDTEVAIAYPLYHAGDPLCCPGGGQRVVHFALNNGKLTALDPIPPANSASGLSRN